MCICNDHIRCISVLPITWKIDSWLRTSRAKYSHRSICLMVILLLVTKSRDHPVPQITPLTGCTEELLVEVLTISLIYIYSRIGITYWDIIREHPIGDTL